MMSKTEVVLSLGDKEAWACMELHGSCRKDLTCVSQQDPETVSMGTQAAGFTPFLTGHFHVNS